MVQKIEIAVISGNETTKGDEKLVKASINFQLSLLCLVFVVISSILKYLHFLQKHQRQEKGMGFDI